MNYELICLLARLSTGPRDSATGIGPDERRRPSILISQCIADMAGQARLPGLWTPPVLYGTGTNNAMRVRRGGLNR